MVVAVTKKNNKVEFKIQAQASLALAMLNLGPSKPLLPTTLPPVQWKNPAPPLRLAGQWFLVWPPDFFREEQKVCKYPKVFNLTEKRVRMRSGFSPLMWDVNLKVQFLMKMTKINLSTNSKHIFL